MSNLSTLLDRYKALVVFDTETSGLDFDNDQIIELAALRVERTTTGGLRIAGKMDTFIKLPEGETLPENIVSLTGITDERLQTEGVQSAKAASQIAKLMQNGPTLMIAHNAQFDACFLRGLLRGQKVGRIDWLDSLTVYKDRRAYPHKLGDAFDLRRDDWELGKRFEHTAEQEAETPESTNQTTDLSDAPEEIKEQIIENDRALKERDAPEPATLPEGFDVVDQLAELLAERKKLHIIDEENLRYNCDIIALEYAIGALRR